jgi:hypothetical protein
MLERLLAELGLLGYTIAVAGAGAFIGALAMIIARCIEIDREEAARTRHVSKRNILVRSRIPGFDDR